jgi:2-polyprenyl-3-methyl-5-hydroxy-6-metoxy-1,4-benzoquinol methylase
MPANPVIRKMARMAGGRPAQLAKRLNTWSIRRAIRQNSYHALVEKLRQIVPDITAQYRQETEAGDSFMETKLRGMHAFQVSLLLHALQHRTGEAATVVDIGDSAGTHMLYLKALAADRFRAETISVNLDPVAIEKIRARGLSAMLCRAEDLDLGGTRIDLFTSFEMLEHLHNPAIFLRRLAKRSNCNMLVITVPYMRKSRVGLHTVRNGNEKPVHAEDEHIFELSSEDWALLMLHSGWRIIHSQTYYQYPRGWPGFSQLLGAYWRQVDFEGFWGAILERDTSLSDLYQDWEN